MHLDGLENFFSVFVASHKLYQPQMTQHEVLYRLEIHSYPEKHKASIKPVIGVGLTVTLTLPTSR
jgi:hypothetical protein